MASIRPLNGFRDFYPPSFAERAHIFAVWRRVAARYGFVEYDGPPLEPLELYTKKSGAEIVDQLYAFVDKGGRDVAMRPEMTPTVARMVAAQAGMVGFIGYGIGVLLAAAFIFIGSAQSDEFKGFYSPWQIPVATAGVVIVMILLTGFLSLRAVLKTDPAEVFR